MGTMQSIKETCVCGAEFKVEGELLSDCSLRHKDFLTAHKVCRELSAVIKELKPKVGGDVNDCYGVNV